MNILPDYGNGGYEDGRLHTDQERDDDPRERADKGKGKEGRVPRLCSTTSEPTEVTKRGTRREGNEEHRALCVRKGDAVNVGTFAAESSVCRSTHGDMLREKIKFRACHRAG